MKTLVDWEASKYLELMAQIGAGLSPEQGQRLLERPKLVERMIATALHNPYEMTVERTLSILRMVGDSQRWRLGEEVFLRLADTAKPWPIGPDSFRSLRIRFGGQNGFVCSANAHIGALRNRLDNEIDLSRAPQFNYPQMNGPVREEEGMQVEWVYIDMGTHLNRVNVENALSDEGFVFAWLFPEYLKAIGDGHAFGFNLCGYALMSGIGEQSYATGHPRITKQSASGKVCIDTVSNIGVVHDCTTPTFLEVA